MSDDQSPPNPDRNLHWVDQWIKPEDFEPVSHLDEIERALMRDEAVPFEVLPNGEIRRKNIEGSPGSPLGVLTKGRNLGADY